MISPDINNFLPELIELGIGFEKIPVPEELIEFSPDPNAYTLLVPINADGSVSDEVNKILENILIFDECTYEAKIFDVGGEFREVSFNRDDFEKRNDDVVYMADVVRRVIELDSDTAEFYSLKSYPDLEKVKISCHPSLWGHMGVE